MKKTIFIIITITLILSACAPSPTPSPSATPAPPTQTPRPPTEIPATTTPDRVEIVENLSDLFPETPDFADCLKNQIPEEYLRPGNKLDQFLAQIKPKLMAAIDWDNIKDDIGFWMFGGELIYFEEGITGVKFVNPDLDLSVPDTNPFDKNIGVCGVVTINGNSYLVTVYEIRDKDAPTETGHDLYFLKLLISLQHEDGTPLSQFEIDYITDTWKNKMNFAGISMNSNPNRYHGGFKDPTFAHLEEESPEYEIWSEAKLAIMRGGDDVHGPLSKFKELEPFLWPTAAHNWVEMDGKPSNMLK